MSDIFVFYQYGRVRLRGSSKWTIGLASGSGRSYKFNIPSLLSVGFYTSGEDKMVKCFFFGCNHHSNHKDKKYKGLHVVLSAFQLISVQDGVNCAGNTGILRSINVLHIHRKPSN